MKSEGPVILAAFANDHSDQARFLRNLSTEAQRIQKVLEPAQDLCPLVLLPGAKLEDILDAFQKYRDRVVVFHYAGHANGFQLLLESASGGVHRIGAKGLASFLGQQQGLQLVFLNGCSTERQAEDLLAAGVGCVIATTQAIDDAVATDFSSRFYKGIVTGAPLQAAYSEAVGAAQAYSGGSVDRLLVPLEGEEVPHETGRWPWLLKLRPGAERVAQWSLPEAAGDPLFGLPPVKPRDLPESPYRHLYRFEDQHAEVFFGRGHEIRELYQRVTAPDSPPVVLFYGPAGVGKSSLLDAGLIPRLEGKNEVRYERREPTLGLGNSLRLAFPMEFRKLSRRDAWIAAEKQLGRPLVIVLDQVEEAFTKPNPQQPDELEEFAQLLRRIFFSAENRPQGRLILGFRKEWFAEIDERLADAQVPRSRIFLERLCRDGAIEAITGPVDDPRLASHYKLTVEAGLPEVIADDLLADPDTPVAPTLQILLTRMWSEACRRNREKPTFDAELYQTLHRDGILLDDFLKQQTEQIRSQLPQAVDSGFLLDLLEFHTTAIGTSAEHPVSKLEQTYLEQTKSGMLAKTLKLCEEAYLLTFSVQESDDGQVQRSSRLLHDTLAPLIRARHEESDLPGQRARRILDNRVVDWLEGKAGIPLDAKDLKEVESALEGTRSWSADEQRLVTASREQRSSNRRWRRVFQGLGIAAVVMIAASGAFAYFKNLQLNQKNLELTVATEKANEATKEAKEEAAKARKEQARGDRTLAVIARDQSNHGVKAAHFFAAASAAIAADDPKQSDELRFAAGQAISGLTLEHTTMQKYGVTYAAWILENGGVCSQTLFPLRDPSSLNIEYAGPNLKSIGVTDNLKGMIRTSRYSPDMARCVSASESTIQACDRQQSRKEHVCLGDARISQQADVVVTWGPSGAAVIVHPWESEPVELTKQPVDVARVSESGQRVLTWSSGQSPALWTRPAEPTGSWTQVELRDIGSTPYDVRLSPEFVDGTDSLVVWSVSSPTVHAWHYTPDGQLQQHVLCEANLEGRCGWATASKAGFQVSDRKPGRAFHFWDSLSKKVWAWRLSTSENASQEVTEMSPNPTLLTYSIGGMSAGPDGQLAVWTDEEISTLRIGTMRQFGDQESINIPHRDRIQAATYSPDGTKLLVWTARVVIPSGISIVGGGENPPGSVQVWETKFGLPVTAPLRRDHPLRGAQWGPDSQSFVVWDEGPLVQSWRITDRPQMHQVIDDWPPEPEPPVDPNTTDPQMPRLMDVSDDKSYSLYVMGKKIQIGYSKEKGGGARTITRDLRVQGVRFVDAATVLEWGGEPGHGFVALWDINSPELMEEFVVVPQLVSSADLAPAKDQLLITTIPNNHTNVRASTIHWWSLGMRMDLLSPLTVHSTSPARFCRSKTAIAFPSKNSADQFDRGPVPALKRRDPRWDVIERTGTFLDPLGELSYLLPHEIDSKHPSDQRLMKFDSLRELQRRDESTSPSVSDWVTQVIDSRNSISKDSL